ncbi:hypothetical protein GH733_018853 [Mirounga leonina]|nr:hypothetical protein GH733_018853 [Mirounga leonina]
MRSGRGEEARRAEGGPSAWNYPGIELAESRSQFSGALEGGSASSEAQPPP